jgi:hypothetical protein
MATYLWPLDRQISQEMSKLKEGHMKTKSVVAISVTRFCIASLV